MKTQSKQKSIPLSAPQVRAALDGRLSAVWEVVKDRGADRIIWVDNGVLVPKRPNDSTYTGWVAQVDKLNGLHLPIECPRRVGDVVYVREKWRDTFDPFNNRVIEYAAGGTRLTDGKSVFHGKHAILSILPKWKSARTMPAWAARIHLRIESVWLVRVRELRHADFCAMGFRQCDGNAGMAFQLTRQEFKKHFTARHGPEAWASNSYIWLFVVSRVEGR